MTSTGLPIVPLVNRLNQKSISTHTFTYYHYQQYNKQLSIVMDEGGLETISESNVRVASEVKVE